MEWEEQINSWAESLEKNLKKITHRLAGLEHDFEKALDKKPESGTKSRQAARQEAFAPAIRQEKEDFLDSTGKAGDSGRAIVFDRADGNEKKALPKILPTRVGRFDQLISDHGIERGSTILVSGGAGTGKTTFSMQSLYNGAMEGEEKGIYLSFEEQPAKIREHMKKNFGMDFEALEKKGLIAIIKIDPAKIARSLEESMLEKEGGLKIEMKKISFPFVPDRICVDSLSALSIAFEKEETYRKYLRELFGALEASNAVSLVLTETEQNPSVYSRSGVEEFLSDGVVVLYNIKKDGKRENALEILKLRSSKHKKGLVPYRFGPKGLEILF